MALNHKKWLSKLINRVRLIGNHTHLRRIKQARKAIQTIKRMENHQLRDGLILDYLRQLDPFVFEELILSVIENGNAYVRRNSRYTGDGGVDGLVHLGKSRAAIQCKRYSGYVVVDHLLELNTQLKKLKHSYGFFIHTGRSSKRFLAAANQLPSVLVISGENLVQLVLGKIKLQELASY